MRQIFILLTLLPALVIGQTAPPSNLHQEDLRVWLKQNWYDGFHTDLGYSGARSQMYGFTDEEGGNIECIYTGFEQPAEFVTFPDPINAEHIIPQSFFGGATPMRSDIHNLRPAHGSVNSARANYPYGEVNDNNANWYGVDAGGNYVSTSTQPSPDDEYSEREGSLFEPRESKKGDIARQVFYFYTMYPTEGGTIDGVGDLNELYTWHVQDPVDAQEILRNDRIEQVQGNRNPYVDYPLAVFEAWLWVEILGCTDPAASNYNANANTDDGSCIVADVEGCTYVQADNYNPLATIDDGSCSFPVGVEGCTYADATNYNPLATEDDGSCTYPSGIEGCTYNEALNFDPTATVDDGSCEFFAGSNGCTYPDAENYDSSATADDGSCIFNSASPCPEDINGDGAIDVTDFLMLLSSFGLSCSNE